MSKPSNGRRQTPRNWLKNWFKSIPREWLAITTVVVIIVISVFAKMGDTGLFKGNLDPNLLDGSLDGQQTLDLGGVKPAAPSGIEGTITYDDSLKGICDAQGMDYDPISGKCVPYSIANPIETPTIGTITEPVNDCLFDWLEKDASGQCVKKCPVGNQYHDTLNDGTDVCVPCVPGQIANDFNECVRDPNLPPVDPLNPVAVAKPIAPTIVLPASASDVFDNGRTDNTDPIEWSFAWKDNTPQASEYEIKVEGPSAYSFMNIDKVVPASETKARIAQDERQWDIKLENPYVENSSLDGWYVYIRAKVGDNWSDWAKAQFKLEPVNTDGGAVVAGDVDLIRPADNTIVLKDNLENGSEEFRWKTASGADSYNIEIDDSNSNSVIDVTTTNTYWKGVVDVDKYNTSKGDWTWRVGARVNGNWVWSNRWNFEVVDSAVPGDSVIDINVDLSEDKYGEIDAEVSVTNVGGGEFDAKNVEFRVENVTDRLPYVDYRGDGIDKLEKGDSAVVYDLQDVPNSSARGNKLIKISMFADGNLVATDQDTIDYDGSNYNPYRPRNGGASGRYVEIKGVVRADRSDHYVLTDENNRFIAYLVNDDADLEDYVGDAVEIDAYVDRYACQGSTLYVDSVRELARGESLANSLDDLYEAGAICYRDIDTRPQYDPASGKVTILVDEDNPWYLRFVIDMFERGIMKGDRDGIFDPARNISIAEVVKMATLSARIPVADEYTCLERGEPWFCNVMGLAEDNAWLPTSALRSPGRQATRAEVVELVLKAFDVTPDYRSRTFPDLDYADRSTGYIEAARRIGVVDGYPDGTFRPYAPINRAEVSKIYSNAIRIIAERSRGL